MDLRENIDQVCSTTNIKFLRITHSGTNKLSGIIFKKCDSIEFEESHPRYIQVVLARGAGKTQRLRTAMDNSTYSIKLTINTSEIIAVRDDNMILNREIECFSDGECPKVIFNIDLNPLYSVELEPLKMSISNAKLMLDVL